MPYLHGKLLLYRTIIAITTQIPGEYNVTDWISNQLLPQKMK